MGSTEIQSLSTLFTDQLAGFVVEVSCTSTSGILADGVNVISIVRKLLLLGSRVVDVISISSLITPLISAAAKVVSPITAPVLPFLIWIFTEACSFASVLKSIE